MATIYRRLRRCCRNNDLNTEASRYRLLIEVSDSTSNHHKYFLQANSPPGIECNLNRRKCELNPILENSPGSPLFDPHPQPGAPRFHPHSNIIRTVGAPPFAVFEGWENRTLIPQSAPAICSLQPALPLHTVLIHPRLNEFRLPGLECNKPVRNAGCRVVLVAAMSALI